MSIRNIVRNVVTCPECNTKYVPDIGEICSCDEEYTDDTHYSFNKNSIPEESAND